MEPNAGTAWSVLGLSKFPDRRSDSHDDGPRRQPASFLFVNYQAQTSQGSTVSKKKHAFIKTMYHRSKKEQRLQKLKASIGPLPTQRSNPSILPSTPGSTTFPIDAEARVEEYEACSFDRALRPAGIDPFASLCVPAKSSVDFYFDHCKIESTSSGRINATDLSDHASRPDRMFLVNLSLWGDRRQHLVVAAINRAAGPIVYHPGNQCLPQGGPRAHRAGPQGRPRFSPGLPRVPAKNYLRTPEHDENSRHKFASVYGGHHRPLDLRRGWFLSFSNLILFHHTERVLNERINHTMIELHTLGRRHQFGSRRRPCARPDQDRTSRGWS